MILKQLSLIFTIVFSVYSQYKSSKKVIFEDLFTDECLKILA